MGLKRISILFDNESGTFYTGSEVSCQLILHLDSPKKVREITVKFTGKAYVSWTEQSSRYLAFSAEELCFKSKFNLAGELIIPAGEHNLRFSTLLPSDIPSSYGSDFGNIRYTVTVVLHRPWKFNHTCRAVFNVICPLNLNYLHNAKAPIVLEKQKVVGMGLPFCKSGPVSLNIMAPRSGYTPGQSIPLTIEIENGTNTDITDCSCFLIQVATYTAQNPRNLIKLVRTEVATLPIGQIFANGSIMWDGDFPIPEFSPVNTSYCKIIYVAYELKFKLSVAGIFNRDVHISTPVIIGTVPFLTSEERHGLMFISKAKTVNPSISSKRGSAPRKALGNETNANTTRNKKWSSCRSSDFILTRSAPLIDTARECLIKKSDHSASVRDVQL